MTGWRTRQAIPDWARLTSACKILRPSQTSRATYCAFASPGCGFPANDRLRFAALLVCLLTSSGNASALQISLLIRNLKLPRLPPLGAFTLFRTRLHIFAITSISPLYGYGVLLAAQPGACFPFISRCVGTFSEFRARVMSANAVG